MKKITVVLLSAIFVLVIGSIQYISADDSTDNQVTSMDKSDVSISSTRDSKFQLHIQVMVRNAQGQLIGVTEAIHGVYVPHKITDDVFDSLFGERKIVTVGGIKYEKVQFNDHFKGAMVLAGEAGVGGLWLVQTCGELVIEHLGFQCANIFEMRTNQVVLESDDTVSTYWTILRAMN